LGGFDENFFMYAEEADLCYRARGLGARPMFTPEATIIHYGGASEKIVEDKIVRLYSGKVQFMRKHWSKLRYAPGIFFLLFGVLLRGKIFGLWGGVSGKAKHMQAARVWMKVWRSRNHWIFAGTDK
jgi:GT2 family glycosyltransferase